MSRIGKQPIDIPEGVEIKIDGNLVVVKGSRGELKREIVREMKIEQNDRQIARIFCNFPLKLAWEYESTAGERWQAERKPAFRYWNSTVKRETESG